MGPRSMQQHLPTKGTADSATDKNMDNQEAAMQTVDFKLYHCSHNLRIKKSLPPQQLLNIPKS